MHACTHVCTYVYVVLYTWCNDACMLPGNICGLSNPNWWLDFMKRYYAGWRVYWVIVRYRNTPVWVAERGGIRFVDRMLHVSVQDQRELARRWTNGNCDTMFDGPGLMITDWLQSRLPLFNSMAHPDEWYETEEEVEDHRYHPWEIDHANSDGWSTSDGYSLERSEGEESDGDWASEWDRNHRSQALPIGS